jgi:alpha-1,2-mannosyltransferase
VRRALLALALCVHVVLVLAVATVGLRAPGEDFASYYNAAMVLHRGGNPYDLAQLEAYGNPHFPGHPVHPFLAPPAFALATLWMPHLAPQTAWLVFAAAMELCALASLALWIGWWRPLGATVARALVVAFAAVPAVWVNLLVGQVNWAAVALAFTGLWLAARGRELAGGAALGVAVVLKLTPATFIVFWLLHGRWRAAASAALTSAIASAAALAIAPAEVHASFFLEVAPQLASGEFGGLRVPLTALGNYSLAGVLARAFPSDGPGLSTAARLVWSTAALALCAAVFWHARCPPADRWQEAGQVASVAALGALLRPHVFEHHLVWLIPSLALGVAALLEGRVARHWRVWMAIASPTLVLPLAAFRLDDATLRTPWLLALEWVEVLALPVVLATSLAVARGARRQPGDRAGVEVTG